MAISSRGEMGVGGGSRGGFGGGGRSVKPSLKKKLAEPKSAVKVVPKGSPMQNSIKNNIATANAQRAKSGLDAKVAAREVASANTMNKVAAIVKGLPKPNTTVKINSGKTTKKAAPAKKAPSYWELKGLPSLVKINSGTGNKTVSPITYRGKATKKAAPAKRATGPK